MCPSHDDRIWLCLQECLSSLFYGAIVIVVNPDQTLGGRIVASASIAGCGWIGLLMTGAAVGTRILTGGLEPWWRIQAFLMLTSVIM